MSAYFVSRVAAFGARILVASAAFSAAAGYAAAQPAGIEDIQIGEKGQMLRIALVCPSDCAVRSAGPGAFIVEGASTDMRIDLSRRSSLADAIVIGKSPGGEGSLLTIEGRGNLSRATLTPCRVGDVKSVCLDYTFTSDADAARSVVDTASATPSASKPPAAQDEAPPPLRERAELPIPLLAAAVSSVGPEGPDRALRPGSSEGFRSAAAFDLQVEAEAALGRSFDAGSCGMAKARLQGDPWALDAMADTAICKAIAGDMAAAEGDLKRLLSYMPGHATALVGRALIAAGRGRTQEADRFFQGALDAPTTLDDASRILAARARLANL